MLTAECHYLVEPLLDDRQKGGVVAHSGILLPSAAVGKTVIGQ
jgi:hypothetical protein